MDMQVQSHRSFRIASLHRNIHVLRQVFGFQYACSPNEAFVNMLCICVQLVLVALSCKTTLPRRGSLVHAVSRDQCTNSFYQYRSDAKFIAMRMLVT